MVCARSDVEYDPTLLAKYAARPRDYSTDLTIAASTGRRANRVDVRRVVGNGEADFAAARAGIWQWKILTLAGLGARASGPADTPGAMVEQYLGIGPFAIVAPCRVVEVCDEPDRAYFTQGAVRGHPLFGEERFEVTLLPSGEVIGHVRSIATLAWPFPKFLSPLVKPIQQLVATYFVRAFGRIIAQSRRSR